jgi:acyl transferase domain-containing protein
MNREPEELSHETQIAIIGMAGRFPGADSIPAFWQRLCGGEETISFFTPEELAASGVPARDREDARYVPARGVVKGAGEFDPSFFGFTPREAQVIDPQQRVLLECAWEAMERAGYRPDGADVPVGVYASAYTSTYLLRNLAPNEGALRDLGPAIVYQGNCVDQVATRISYELGLTGPSVTVQTACSSSLVAVHMAVQALLVGECKMALAGGVRIVFPQTAGYLRTEGGIESSDGHCRPFDARADGTVFSDAAALVVLKPLADALRDGDTIHAVIRGSSINNDGARKVGFTAPSVVGQVDVLRDALAMADVAPETIGYVEAHGTGTPVGDPIEVRALAEVYGDAGNATGTCALGSVKANIGHCDTAAGVVGLIKTALAVESGRIPGTPHFETANPKLDLGSTPFFVQRETIAWPRPGVRRAGVSALGVGGTNVHVVLEEAPATKKERTTDARPHALVVSARSPAALVAAVEGLSAHLAAAPLEMGDVAFTLGAGRTPFAQRCAVVARTPEEAQRALAGEGGHRALGFADRAPEGVAFLFPGQGAQYPRMAAELYADEPVFRTLVDRGAALLAPEIGVDLRDLLFAPPSSSPSEDSARLRDTAIAQPALFLIEYALAELRMAYGDRPAALLGHSDGEYVAA